MDPNDSDNSPPSSPSPSRGDKGKLPALAIPSPTPSSRPSSHLSLRFTSPGSQRSATPSNHDNSYEYGYADYMLDLQAGIVQLQSSVGELAQTFPARLDTLSQDIDSHNAPVVQHLGTVTTSIDALRQDTTASIDAVRQDVSASVDALRRDMTSVSQQANDINDRVADQHNTVTTSIDALRQDTTVSIDAIRQDVSASFDALRRDMTTVSQQANGINDRVVDQHNTVTASMDTITSSLNIVTSNLDGVGHFVDNLNTRVLQQHEAVTATLHAVNLQVHDLDARVATRFDSVSEAVRDQGVNVATHLQTIDNHADELVERLEEVRDRVGYASDRVDQAFDRLDQVRARVDDTRDRVDLVTNRIDQVRARVEEVHDRVGELQRRTGHITTVTSELREEVIAFRREFHTEISRVLTAANTLQEQMERMSGLSRQLSTQLSESTTPHVLQQTRGPSGQNSFYPGDREAMQVILPMLVIFMAGLMCARIFG
ncbi:hypothetical protein K474DRAFT_1703171 [Panus rudis PR-1116 ss-1]|nr:hypothetical protein K474DRAFT_1703171 [Panus rudis PR-1116 ss-1]